MKDLSKNPFKASTTKLSNFDRPDVVLIQCPGWGIETPPLSLASLTSYARANGFKVLPLDLNVEHFCNRTNKFEKVWDIDQSQSFWNNHSFVNQYADEMMELILRHVAIIVKTKTPLVAFSTYNSCMSVTLVYARLIREFDPSIKIVVGGPHASLNMGGSFILEQDYIDAIAQGEGEFTFVDIISHIKDNKPLNEVKGLVIKDADKKFIHTPKRDPNRALSELPFADFSDYKFSVYLQPEKLPLMSSRGCPNQCIYCSEVVYWETFRTFEGKRIVDEIEHHFTSYPHLKRVEFQDSLVNGHIGKLETFADEVISRNLRFEWSGQAVIRKEMTLPLFKKLKASGCVCLAFGLETSSVGLMMGIGKLLARQTDIDRLVSEAHEAGLSCAYNFMFGMPGETEDDALKSLEFLRNHKDHVGTVNPSAAFCGFTRGTPGYDEPAKFGIVPSPVEGQYWVTSDGTNDLLVRLRRFEAFCDLAVELKVPTTYPHRKLIDRDRIIGAFHYHAKNYQEAIKYLEKWIEEHPGDEEIIWYLKVSRENLQVSAHSG